MMWAVAFATALLLGGTFTDAVKNKDFSEKAEIFSSECSIKYEIMFLINEIWKRDALCVCVCVEENEKR